MTTEVPQDKYCIIIVHPGAKSWTNQTGGYACHHPVCEGYLIELDDSINDAGFFVDGWEIDIDKAQEYLNQAGVPFIINRDFPGEEAWVRGKFCGADAILTYGNSD